MEVFEDLLLERPSLDNLQYQQARAGPRLPDLCEKNTRP